jgi:hypothetical protein
MATPVRFEPCPPFAGYTDDGCSYCMTQTLAG